MERRATFIRALLAAVILVASSACRTQSSAAAVDETAQAHFLANAGVLITRAETKVVFDPLFRNDFGTYQLLPEAFERALFAGEPPFDGLDAVFISHYHEDHFSAADILRLLMERPDLELYAPAQAVSEMRSIAAEHHQRVFAHVTEISLAYRDDPIAIEAGELLVEAVRIPHSGWPERRRDVENLAFRVTLSGETTVVHLGDADTREAHYAQDAEYWDERDTDIAFPPYWYFPSEEGRRVLDERLQPARAVGVHVPVEMRRPEDRPPELRGYDLFVEPGETREVP